MYIIYFVTKQRLLLATKSIILWRFQEAVQDLLRNTSEINYLHFASRFFLTKY